MASGAKLTIVSIERVETMVILMWVFFAVTNVMIIWCSAILMTAINELKETK